MYQVSKKSWTKIRVFYFFVILSQPQAPQLKSTVVLTLIIMLGTSRATNGSYRRIAEDIIYAFILPVYS